MYQQIIKYFDDNNAINGAQFGFRAGMGTQDAIGKLIDQILSAFEHGEYALLSVYDISKAFDCINHKFLISKLRHYGFDRSSCAMISSYFRGRSQIVRVGSECSRPLPVECGTAQGSILGPLLFIIFLNDLPASLNGVVPVFYADDTSTISRSRILEDVVGKAAHTSGDVEKWFNCNGFSLNRDKSAELLFTLRNHNLQLDRSSLNILGVHIDPKLTWSMHGEALSGKLCSAVFLLRRLSCTVDGSVLRVTYFAVFHSQISYCILHWGHSAICSRMFALQRRAVRVVGGLAYTADCKATFIRLRIMTLPSLYIYRCLQYIIRNYSKYTSCGFECGYNIREKENLRLERHRIYKSRCGTNYWGVKFFNALPKNIRQLPEKKFDKHIRQFLLDKAFYAFDEFLRGAASISP